MSLSELNVEVFNASVSVTELLMKTLENSAKSLASRCIVEASKRHGFDASVEISLLGLETVKIIRKPMSKKSVINKAPALKEKKSVFPLPFVPTGVDMNGCRGLAYNRGLFTQCAKTRMENGSFCKTCQTESDKNASGCPDCGTVDSRLASGLYEFKDPKGRSPVSYMKVLDKLKLNKDAALEAAGKLNIEIPASHFAVVVIEKSKKSKGRPKKTGTIEADNVTDLFAKLSCEEDCEEEVIEDNEDSVDQKQVKTKKVKLTEEEKAVKKQALEEERALKKLERDNKIAQERLERENKRKAEAELKKQERMNKTAQEKIERETKRAQEKLERENKKAAEKGSKKSVTKTETNVAVVVNPVVEAPTPAPTLAPTPAKVSVTRIQIGGKAYLKSSTNILYDPNTKEEVGLWDPESKTIKELPEDDDEVEEEDYEEDA